MVTSKTALNCYVIKEPGQKPFELNARGLAMHQTIKPDAVGGNWPCFRNVHPYALKGCDRVVISWDKKGACPKYLLIELKSTNSGGAHKQLGASLAFCHFLHRMVCVGQIAPPLAQFASVTVWNFPNALKNTSTPKLPPWNSQGLQPDCKHMHYGRASGSLPLGAVLVAI
jgi:hypothetical protein